MLLDVVQVRPRENYQLDLVFANGERRRFDMRPLMNMKPWNGVSSPGMFAQSGWITER